MKNLMFLLLTILTITACAPRPITPAGRPSQYAEHHKAIGFEGWYIEECKMVMRVSDMQISSIGELNSNKNITFKIETNRPLLALPSLSFNTIDWTPAAVGKNRNFAFDIPYNSIVAAEMSNDYAYLIITYQSADSRALQQHFFKLKGVPHALAYLQGKCGS